MPVQPLQMTLPPLATEPIEDLFRRSARMPPRRLSLRLREGVQAMLPERTPAATRYLRGNAEDSRTIVDEGFIGFMRTIPFDQCEFRPVQRAALAVAERAGKLDDARLAGREKFLAGEFRRGPQIATLVRAPRSDQIGREGMKMGFVSRRDRQRRGLNLDEAVF